MTKDTMGIDFQAACLVYGPTDDYESWNGDLPDQLHKHKTVLYVYGRVFLMRNESHTPARQYHTEVTATESHEVMILMSGAWKT